MSVEEIVGEVLSLLTVKLLLLRGSLVACSLIWPSLQAPLRLTIILPTNSLHELVLVPLKESRIIGNMRWDILGVFQKDEVEDELINNVCSSLLIIQILLNFIVFDVRERH